MLIVIWHPLMSIREIAPTVVETWMYGSLMINDARISIAVRLKFSVFSGMRTHKYFSISLSKRKGKKHY